MKQRQSGNLDAYVGCFNMAMKFQDILIYYYLALKSNFLLF